MNKKREATAEEKRLDENRSHKVFWKQWGPYLSERQWGTVREDYSPDGEAWDFFPHDHARSRVYRWGEDGLGGISDIRQNLCFALALWNGKDPILKERLYGLTGREGNHGEDVKELYYYLDNLPTHSYMKFLYKYTQREFPYGDLLNENKSRSRQDSEYELLDTGVFKDNRYFDVFVEYAKSGSEDILIKVQVFNRADVEAELTLLPTLWFRNTWASGKVKSKPQIKLQESFEDWDTLAASHEELGEYFLYCQKSDRILFTENETNNEKLFNTPNQSPFVKDSFHSEIIDKNVDLLKDKKSGTKVSPVYSLKIPGGKSKTIRLRLTTTRFEKDPFSQFENIVSERISEANAFYSQFLPSKASDDEALVQRQAFAGLLWSKQYYNFEIETWLNGDKDRSTPPAERKKGRNSGWKHLFNRDIISMPDKWEYPWYAVWDQAFHCVPFALLDPDFAKNQILLPLKEWYMHPNGQLPAYEWDFGDVNPPVHAWATLKVYEIEKKNKGKGDLLFLKRVFQKLTLNFTWWVNRKDAHGHNIFQGGFLGLDNIGVFDRSKKLPTGGHIEQADGTAWMAMYSLNLMEMAIEIAQSDPAYEDVASKFFEHFVRIAESLNQFGEYLDQGLWHEEDGFFYDVLHMPDGATYPLRVRSLVGLVSLFAVAVINKADLDNLKEFKKRMLWFRNNRKDLDKFLAVEELKEGQDVLLSLTHKRRLLKILQRVLDENEFLSPGGIRSISKYHKDKPFIFNQNGEVNRVGYEPAESKTNLFGGNSNWRGPIWFPMNYLLINSLKKYYHYYGDEFKVEFPTGSGKLKNLLEVADALSHKMTNIFKTDGNGKRPVHGNQKRYSEDPFFKNLVLFYEYFHGDSCEGLGASHQTGWTGLVAEMIHSGRYVNPNFPEHE